MSHVLVVDDDNDAARMMAALITKRQFTVATANTLRDARRQIALQRPDLLLLDLQLPDMSGEDVLAGLRGCPETAGIAVVVLSGSAMAADIERLSQAGADAYWTKPIDFDQFCAGVPLFLCKDQGVPSDDLPDPSPGQSLETSTK